MADPTKTPNNPAPNNIHGKSTVGPSGGPVIRSRSNRPWVWIVVIILILLLIWAFFGWNSRSRVVNPVTAPASAVSTVH